MKKLNAIVIGGIAAASQIAQAGKVAQLPVKDLNQVGINPVAIQEAYQEQANVQLNWDEVVKVSADEEGKNINVNTIDGISIVVGIDAASGPFNKGDGLRD